MDDRYARFAADRAKPPPLTSGGTLHWDGRDAISQGLERLPHAGLMVCRNGPASLPVAGHQVGLLVSRLPHACVPALPAPPIDWLTEALRLTFYLDPALLLGSHHTLLPRLTGTLMWVHGTEDEGWPLPRARPALLVKTLDTALQAVLVELVFDLLRSDPLLHHMAAVLHTTVHATGEAERLYAGVLADALVVHCFSRYRAIQLTRPEVSGGLVPYRMQRTLSYIQTHLDQKMSLAMLAAVAQMSPGHFAHLFKHSTGLPPHQYVSQSRVQRAQQLLVKTDMTLSEIAHQVGCADQSHFTALFRAHAALTPKAYRNANKQE